MSKKNSVNFTVFVGYYLNISCHSLEGLLELLASRVNAENHFHICVLRDNLLERGLKQWQRQKKGNPVNQLKVTFIGEAGIDSGALRKEFLTGKLLGIIKVEKL